MESRRTLSQSGVKAFFPQNLTEMRVCIQKKRAKNSVAVSQIAKHTRTKRAVFFAADPRCAKRSNDVGNYTLIILVRFSLIIRRLLSGWFPDNPTIRQHHYKHRVHVMSNYPPRISFLVVLPREINRFSHAILSLPSREESFHPLRTVEVVVYGEIMIDVPTHGSTFPRHRSLLISG